MRIMLVHWAMPPTIGGVESHLVSLASGFAALGHDVAVLSGEAGPEELPRVTSLFHPALRKPQNLSPRMRADLSGAVAGWRPDVVHAHNLHPLSRSTEEAVVDGAREVGASAWHTWHAEWSDHEWPPPSSLWNGLLTASDYLRGCLHRRGIDATSLPLPVDTGHFDGPPLVGREGPLKLFFPARLVPEKGPLVALDAFARVLDAGVEATLTLADTPRIFDGNEESERFIQDVKEKCASDFGPERVSFLRSRFVDMPGAYASSHIVLYPSIFPEPHGLAVLEAMSCRRVVIATAVGGVRETVVSGHSGVLVPTPDPGLIGAAVLSLVGDWTAARRLADHARERVARHYRLDAFLERLLKIYAGL